MYKHIVGMFDTVVQVLKLCKYDFCQNNVFASQEHGQFSTHVKLSFSEIRATKSAY